MKLITKLRVFFLLMLALALSGASLSVWSSRQASFYLDRIGLAHMVYEANLELSNHTYQLFKQFGDSLIIGDSNSGPDEKFLLITQIRANIDHIRDLIGREIELAGTEEIEELEDLSQLEAQIENLISELTEITANTSKANLVRDWGRLSVILDGTIDRDFRTKIESALQEERQDSEETRVQVQEQLTLYQGLSVLFALLAVAVAVVSLVVFRRSVQSPMAKLSQGAKKLSSGNLSHHIDATGGDEIAQLARALNLMARRVEAREKRLKSSNEELERMVADRTERLEILLEETRKAEANRKQLMADVSHELRTPLTIIKGEADNALRGSKTQEDYHETLTRVHDAANQTNRLVDDLLFVARSEAGETKLDLKEMDLLEISRTVARESGQEMSVVSNLSAAPLLGDYERLRQVVLILLENARHFGGGTIDMQLNCDANDTYWFKVSDDGHGMTADEKKNAFERYYRGTNASGRYGDGTGLGLPVARSIVEAHGGAITLEDRSGGGLTATVTLPAKSILKAAS